VSRYLRHPPSREVGWSAGENAQRQRVHRLPALDELDKLGFSLVKVGAEASKPQASLPVGLKR
jgi:hypothetical protein